MLIPIARRVSDQRALTRTLFTVVVVTVAVIAGLLAMHSMNTHAMISGHSDTVVAHDGRITGSEQAVVADDPAASGCATYSDDHGIAWMACVLALLAAGVLLARPTARWHPLGPAPQRATIGMRARVALHPLEPPSLTVLCISRT